MKIIVDSKEAINKLVSSMVSKLVSEKPDACLAFTVVVKVILWLLGIALLLLAGFMALAYFCPDFIDTLLYSPDEIELLKAL